MASHDQYQEWISMYALGGLSGPERVQMQAHLSECAACRQRYRQARALVQMPPQAIEPVEPSPETKMKLFARVDADLARANTASQSRVAQRAPAPPAKRGWFRRPALAFAALALLGLLAVAGWLLLNRSSPEQQQIAAILSDPNVQKVALAGTKDAPNASAEIYMAPGHSAAVLQVNGLAPLPADKGYEFWFFRNGEPQPSNVFTVTSTGTTTVLVNANDKVENFKGWGVTIEPITGVPKPTGTIVILGGL
ncbi:MAG: anti-sigma factor [Chloroflexi bacterium]|nr:anti-sigma factor [Chloroflexota bacterium]